MTISFQHALFVILLLLGAASTPAATRNSHAIPSPRTRDWS